MADVNAIIQQLQAAAALPDLASGATGANVSALQTSLNMLGLTSPALAVDGTYGPQTAAAVQALRDLYAIGKGDFDAALRTGISNDLLAGPNAAAVLRALNVAGGVVLPPANQGPQISLDQLVQIANVLGQAALTGAAPDIFVLRTALAFLNYFPPSMLQSTDPSAQAATDQALLAFVRQAWNDPSISSASSVNAGDIYSRLAQSVAQAAAAQGGPAASSAFGQSSGSKLPLIIGAGMIFFALGGKKLLGLGGVGDGYGYDFDTDYGDGSADDLEDQLSDEFEDEEEDDEEEEEAPPPKRRGKPDRALLHGGSLAGYEIGNYSTPKRRRR